MSWHFEKLTFELVLDDSIHCLKKRGEKGMIGFVGKEEAW